MNEKSFSNPADEIPFDRLVDGELSPQEYRETLLAIESAPDGWRHLALAFLEAQALGVEIGGVRREIDVPMRASKEPLPKASVGNLTRFAMAIAASLLIAVGLGYALRGWVSSQRPGAGDLVHAERPNGAAKQTPVAGRETSRVKNEIPAGNLTLLVDDGNARGELIDVPVYDASDAAEKLSFEQPALPVDVRRAFERTGHRIEERRQLVPVSLQDGRQVVLPVEQYHITPAVRRSY